MAKSKSKSGPPQVAVAAPVLFASAGSTRKQRALIVPNILAKESESFHLRGPEQDRAWELCKRWADMERGGFVAKTKETSIDAEFLLDIFGEALGFTPAKANHDHYHLERQYPVPNVGRADGALGHFGSGRTEPVVAIIEMKGANTDLDRDKSNGRTAVQQCFDYLNALPDCPWGIVSNVTTIRLYHRRTNQAYQEFKLQDLRKQQNFREFYCLFQYDAFLGKPPRALRLLQETETRQREVGDELYDAYSKNRFELIEHLCADHGKNLDRAIHIAQKILDRIIFIAFCEDRGLLPQECLKKGWTEIPPYTRIVNPRWRNFIDLFNAIDKGHNIICVEQGYNGGLFRHDPEVDDLQLADSWTDFFKAIGNYDFRTEVNVDVLGHIFERSIGELEQFRLGGGMFGPKGNAVKSAMPKSAERKRFGTYYTPPDFTAFIVEQTVGAIISKRLATIRETLGLTEKALEADKPSAELAHYWAECYAALKSLKICDPACGSGAFLIQAFDFLDAKYRDVLESLAFHTGEDPKTRTDAVADDILNENLYGADLSEQAVEITQLALWLRSADPGKRLADLSANIVWGNSLVSDPAVHPKAMTWESAFSKVFGREHPGFDCVIGNPPWERMKLQEREFFAHSAPEIAQSVSASERRKLIGKLEAANPELFRLYTDAQSAAERTSLHIRQSGAFPLTAKGDINTYMIFAELARKIVAPTGRVGLLVPSGIATDHTTREFFGTLMETKALAGLYDFENKLKIFPDVDGRFKFTALLFGGSEMKYPAADFVFFAHKMEDLQEKKRHIALSGEDMALLNPNTKTCPIFRTRRDAEVTKAIYKRIPILIDKGRVEGGNPWGIRFLRMFDQTNDAELFQSPEQLLELKAKLKSNRWATKETTYLPLYEAKMIQSYDHRAASVVIEAGNWVRQGQTEDTTLVAHQNPEYVVQPRWWVEETAVLDVMKDKRTQGSIGFKDITSPTNQRTMIASAMPWAAATNHYIMTLTSAAPRLEMCLLGNLNSFVLDYVTRQKIGGITLNFFIVEQLPVLPPERYAEKCPWSKRQTLEKWISDRVLKLTCTANDMIPLAEAAGFDPPVHRWNEAERATLRAELDAAYFLLYGIDRADAEYILGTFQGLKDDATGALVTKATSQTDAILALYDRFAAAK